MSNRRNYFIIYLCAAIGPLAGNAILSMWAELETDLAASYQTVMLSIPAFMFPFAILQLFSGTISDKWGRKQTLLAGLIIYGLASLGIVFTPDIGSFLILRIAQGIGNAFIAPVALAMLGDITDRSRYGVAMGLYGSFTTAGITVGPLIGGYLAVFDWHLTFAVFAILALVSTALVVALLSYPGVSSKHSCESLAKNLRLAVGHRNIVKTSLIGAMTFFAAVGSLAFLSEFLRNGSGLQLTSWETGLIISIGGFIGIFSSWVAGKFTDRCSPRLSSMVGYLITIPAVFMTAFANQFSEFLVLSTMNGIGTSFIWTGLLTLSVGEVPALRGTSSSIFNSSRFTGYAFNTILLTPIYATSSYPGIAYAAASILLVCLLLSFTLPKKPCAEKPVSG